MKEATEKTPRDEYNITAKLHFLHRLVNGYLAAKIVRSRLFHNHRRFTLNDIMEQVVAMEGDYQTRELFTGDISQIMGIEEEINDVSANDRNLTPKRSQSFNHCYKCSKTGHFQKDCPGDGDEENVEPQHKIIGTVTHTMEAQTPVTDKSLSDFMYKNFKQTEKLKKKYTATKTKLKRTKQELDEVKNRKSETTFTTTENISPKKTVTFAKNTTPKKSLQKGKVGTKNKTNRTTTTTVTTPSSSVPKTRVKTEPVSLIETEDTSDDYNGDEVENITEIDTEESSSSCLTESDLEELLGKGSLSEKYLSAENDRDYIEEVVIGKEERALITARIKHKKCKALIDTGASRSCISEKNYKEMQLPPVSELFAVRVTSANGSPIKVLGITKCPVILGKEQYEHTFMVCRNVKRSMI